MSSNRHSFGSIADSITDRVDDPSAAGVDRYVGLEHIDPGVMTVMRWDAPESVEAQKLRFQPGDVIFGRRRAYQKKVAQADFSGICSAHALVLRARRDVIAPVFLPVFLSSDYFLDRAIEISVGSLSPTVNWRDLERQEFELPALDVQERLAALAWAIEGDIRAQYALANATRAALHAELGDRFDSMTESKRLGDIAVSRSGPSFSAAAVRQTPAEGSLPVMGITNTRADGTVDVSSVDHVIGLPDSTSTIDESSLVLIRTNGNRQRIGNVYIPPQSTYGFAVSAFQFLLKVFDQQDRDYVYWALNWPTSQDLLSAAASGSTGLGNLGVGRLNAHHVPWHPERNKRDDLVIAANAFVRAEVAIGWNIRALSSFRTSFLAQAFGGNS